MLLNSEIRSAVTAADGLTYDKTIEAAPGSPLALVCKHSRPTMIPVDAIPGEIIEKTAAAVTADGYNLHTAELDAVVTFVAKRCKATHVYAKSTINPLVRELMGECEDIQTNSFMGIGDASIDINRWTIPSIYGNQTLLHLIENTATRSADDKLFSMKTSDYLLNGMNEDDFIEMMSGDNSSLKAAIEELHELDKLVPWSKAFGNFLSDDYAHTTSISNPEANSDIVGFLFLNGILSSSLDLTVEVKHSVEASVRILASRVKKRIDELSLILEKKKIVLEAQPTSVTVVDFLYDEWCENDGSPEALIGWFKRERIPTSGKLPNSLSELLYGNEEVYVKHYERLVKTLEGSSKVVARTEITRAVRARLIEAIKEQYETVSEQNVHIEAFNTYMDDNEYHGNLELDDYLLKATCTALMSVSSDAYLVLATMRSLMRDDPTMSSTLAATCASVRLIVRWLRSQIKVTYTGGNIVGSK